MVSATSATYNVRNCHNMLCLFLYNNEISLNLLSLRRTFHTFDADIEIHVEEQYRG
jgi:hypothetical protein